MKFGASRTEKVACRFPIGQNYGVGHAFVLHAPQPIDLSLQVGSNIPTDMCEVETTHVE